MTNYVVTTYSTQGDMVEVLTALETKLETIDNAKTIRSMGIVAKANNFYGWIIYDT